MTTEEFIAKEDRQQLTLKDIIEKCEKILYSKEPDKQKEITVCFDFGTAVPDSFCSNRGDYSHLSMGYKLTGYDNMENHFNDVTLVGFLNDCKETIGKTFEGWKGGAYTMHENTRLWVSNAGDSGNCGIIEVCDDGWRVILMTSYFQF